MSTSPNPATSQTAGDNSNVAGRDANINYVNVFVDGTAVAAPLPSPPEPTQRVRFGLPPKPDRMEGRDKELAQLEDWLTASTGAEASVVPNTVHGMGGIGKSAMSLWFAYQHLADFSFIWWIDAEYAESVPGQYMQLAQALGYGSDLTPQDAFNAISHQLATRDTWLLVFDNAQTRADIANYLPTVGTGSVLVTSRNAHGWPPKQSIQLEVLDAQTVINWLVDAVEADTASAERLADLLDGLPLAVTQAAGYCTANGTPLATYAALFTEEQHKLMAVPAGVIDNEATVDTTLGLSIAALDQDPDAAGSIALLEFCSYLAADRIPFDLFTPESLDVAAQSDVETAIGKLRRYSLVNRDPATNLLYIHRLVQDITRHRIQQPL